MTALSLKSIFFIISACIWCLLVCYKLNVPLNAEQINIQILDGNINNRTNNILINGHAYNAQIIFDNPLRNNKCMNAIIEKENINTTYLQLQYAKIVKKKCGHVPNVTDWSKFIFNREFLSSLSSMEIMRSQCYWQHHHFMSVANQTDINDPHIDSKTSIYPKYYHIPKSGSSSIHIMLQTYFNFVAYWQSHNQRGFKHIKNWGMAASHCGFTFVRQPITRLISGYYTINKVIFVLCNFTFIHCQLSKWNKYKFIKIMGEPQRFDMFVSEMVSNPWKFANNTPFRHVASQTFFLSNWQFFDDLKFVGKVEYFEPHWIRLLTYCQWFKYQMQNELHQSQKYQLLHNVTFAMRHFGLDMDIMNNTNEYMAALSLNVSGEQEVVTQPIYHLLSEKTYNLAVNHYWQDYVCFNYISQDYNTFQQSFNR